SLVLSLGAFGGAPHSLVHGEYTNWGISAVGSAACWPGCGAGCCAWAGGPAGCLGAAFFAGGGALGAGAAGAGAWAWAADTAKSAATVVTSTPRTGRASADTIRMVILNPLYRRSAAVWSGRRAAPWGWLSRRQMRQDSDDLPRRCWPNVPLR